MSNSEIKLYVGTKLSAEKNFVIEDISQYLLQFTTVTITDFQYIRPQSLDLTIKINKTQADLHPLSANDIDYCRVKDSDSTKFYYYFVTNKTWRSANTIELTLRLDVLNTYSYNGDYTVDKKTLVTREHKDRVKLLEGSTLASPAFSRVIHLFSEGINAPLYKDREFQIDDKVNTTWSLMYKNKDAIDPSEFNQVNPVDCYLMPNEEQKVVYAQTSKTINPSDLPTWTGVEDVKAWLFNPNKQANIEFKGSNGNVYKMSFTTSRNHWVNFIGVVLQRSLDGTTISLALIEYYRGTDLQLHYKIKQTIQGLTYVEILNSPSTIIYLLMEGTLPDTESELYGNATGYTYQTIDWSSYQTTSLIDDSFIDRTDSKTIKIINLPYCPTPYEIEEISDIEYMTFAPTWEIKTSDKCLKLKDTEERFLNTIKMDSTRNPFDVMIIDWTTETDEKPNPTRTRRDYMESKIYHSDYFAPKFVYDSFNLTFRCEWLDFDEYWKTRDTGDEYYGLGFDMNFVMTRNIVSKFLFIFPQYITKYSQIDYDNVVAVARNNEEVLYTSQYINYIRSGYNYDIKAKQRAEVQMGAGLTASAITSLVGIVGGVASQNYALAITSAIGAGVSIATQSVSYAKSVADMESNIAQKLDDSQRQAISVKNADDLDLLFAYSNNKAKMCFYEVSPTMKQSLLDMFYYCGYATQEQKVPTVTSRYWFNFLQCNLVVAHTNNIPSDIVDVIIARFKEGVTFFHHHTTWDVAQVKENYESWILA